MRISDWSSDVCSSDLSLSLLLSYADSFLMFAGLKTVIIDEVHAFATQKRGDILNLSLSRLQSINPGLRPVALSATVAAVDAYRAWLAPDGDIGAVKIGRGSCRESGCQYG